MSKMNPKTDNKKLIIGKICRGGQWTADKLPTGNKKENNLKEYSGKMKCCEGGNVKNRKNTQK